MTARVVVVVVVVVVAVVVVVVVVVVEVVVELPCTRTQIEYLTFRRAIVDHMLMSWAFLKTSSPFR